MYQRLASDVDLEEEADITQLEGPSPAVMPTVMGVEAGRTTLEAAVRAGAIIVSWRRHFLAAVVVVTTVVGRRKC